MRICNNNINLFSSSFSLRNLRNPSLYPHVRLPISNCVLNKPLGTANAMSYSTHRPPKLRIAVEGCGHGTLHSIYASVEESCRVNGWDGVDVLFIGGDFQAVRNKVDLNVTAMPAKYRKMADFHEYYSGARSAPYLTIFIGGNHEASNHLYELYYGGWVAPNIYYMGAANILRLGPLRIAGLSGIWKGYDYRKPHFERLPYNESESVSIFHVRELDVRKMLSVRTQVDIGLSHDWPQGVEWKGDYRWLFRKKDRFEADANEGRLGSVAARQCLDRLRPQYWFSAHLHIKYAAIVQHGDYEWVRPPREHRPRHGAPPVEPASARAQTAYENGTACNFSDPCISGSVRGDHQDHSSRTIEEPQKEISSTSGLSATAEYSHKASSTQKASTHGKISAWQNFHVEATEAEAHETQVRLREERRRAVEEERTGTRDSTKYIYDETWKQVRVADGEERGITSVSRLVRSPGEGVEIAKVDGCVESKWKRPRTESPETVIKNSQMSPPSMLKIGLSGQLDGEVPVPPMTATTNLDEIEIDLSDNSSEDSGASQKVSCSDSSRLVSTGVGQGGISEAASRNPNKRMRPATAMSEDSDEGGVKLDPTCPPFIPGAGASFQANLVEDQVHGEASMQPSTVEAEQEQVSDTLRAQLAQLSSSFAPIPTQMQVSAPLPLPETISNTSTQFLALDKCERGRDFLQLLEIESITEQSPCCDTGPYKLQYDKEWLAIQRVFAPELELGGDANGKIPPHRGDTYYRERIIVEEEWIEAHVVQRGRLEVPQNFTITAPVYDEKEEVPATAMPREYTNPQTSAFCELIGIENKFDASEEERDMRMADGPHQTERHFSRGDRGGRRGGRSGGFNARGRGGTYNGGMGGRGRGRGGRGRGRSGW